MTEKYQILVQILDKIRDEARNTKWEQRYAVDSYDENLITSARSRAYIHLYIKVMFGIMDFCQREKFVTDGSYDGGVDGYFIDSDSKTIYLIQSKFRTSASNFESKNISYDELLSMDINRILDGNEDDEKLNPYNGKINGLVREISQIPDIGRYSYKVIIIANCDIEKEKIRRLTGGYDADVFDFSRAYNDLVFPVICGVFFKADSISIQLNLDNKSAGAKTSYSVDTPDYECEITVLFVPTIEIARVMDKYKNAILEYNPRSYLELDGKSVAAAIKDTLLKPDSNEFALMNNGITILSDETRINEKIGMRNKAQLCLLNPQIINGGQTAYTLSRALQECGTAAEEKFKGKEVLVKVITLSQKINGSDTHEERERLIEEISSATNRQTPVISTDKLSNENVHIHIQRTLFDKFGILYERKRGEFSDGIFSGYINKNSILDRNIFMRIMLVSHGRINQSVKRKIFETHGFSEEELLNKKSLERFAIGYDYFQKIAPRNTNFPKRFRDILGKVYIYTSMVVDSKISPSEAYIETENAWSNLVINIARSRDSYYSTAIDRNTGLKTIVFNPDRWIAGRDFQNDLVGFVKAQLASPKPWSEWKTS